MDAKENLEILKYFEIMYRRSTVMTPTFANLNMCLPTMFVMKIHAVTIVVVMITCREI